MPARTRSFPLVLSVAAVATLLVPLGLSGPGQLAGAVPAEAKHRTATAGVGLFFLPQTPSLPGAVRFVASPPGARIAVLDDGLTVTLAPAPGRRAEHPLPAERRPARGGAIRLRFVEAAAASPVTGSRPLDAPVRYYIGDDERAWREDVRAFSRVEQRGLYPGIDVAYYGTGGLLEYDLTVAPGADVSRVRLAIDGARPGGRRWASRRARGVRAGGSDRSPAGAGCV